GPLQSEVARLDLLEILDQTRDQNQDLKQQLAAAQSRVEQLQQVVSRLEEREAVAVTGTTEQAPSNANRPGPPVAAAPEPDEAVGPTEYTVEPGDTLNSIARKMYGTTTRWMDIYQANRDQLPNEHSLRVGQTLRIPR
ncbi:MAG: LysM peptidoglycan-binding domain-containing protein, partial [Opitutales bacterium]